MRGGYQIIDLKDAPLYSGFLEDYGENHITVKGIYYNLYHSNAKMILLSGLNMDNKPHRDYEIIPYEENNEFKAILKKVWNTEKHIVYTYFLHIADDDDVYITYEELDYDRVDTEFNKDSDIAIANSTVTKKVNELDEEDLTFLKLDGSRKMTGDLDVDGHTITGGRNKIGNVSNMTLSKCKLSNNLNAANKTINNLATPTDDNDAVRLIDLSTVRNEFQTYKDVNNDVIICTLQDENLPMNSMTSKFTPTVVEFEFQIVSATHSLGNTTTYTDTETVNKIAKLFLNRGITTGTLEYKANLMCKLTGSDAVAPVNVYVSLNFDGTTANYTMTVAAVNSDDNMGSIYSYNGCGLLLVKED